MFTVLHMMWMGLFDRLWESTMPAESQKLEERRNGRYCDSYACLKDHLPDSDYCRRHDPRNRRRNRNRDEWDDDLDDDDWDDDLDD
jgi:hypothetical protein